MKNIKIIYDIQDSIMIIFCHKEYARAFETRMIETYSFKRIKIVTDAVQKLFDIATDAVLDPKAKK